MKARKQIALLSILLFFFNQSKAQTSSRLWALKRINWKDVVVMKYDPSVNDMLQFDKDCLEGEAIMSAKNMTGSLQDLTKKEIKRIKQMSAYHCGKTVFVDTRHGIHSVRCFWFSCDVKKI